MDLSKDSTHLVVNEFTQFFVDNLMIEQVHDITRRWYQPERVSDGPILERDRPWEHITYFTYSNYNILLDESDGLFKCWYEDMEAIPGETSASGQTKFRSRQLYAYSEDGIHFTKPELDIHLVDGRKSNIVLGGPEQGSVHSASMVIDPFPSNPQCRFRSLFTHDGGNNLHSFGGIKCAHSPDGIHWIMDEETPRFGSNGPHLNDVSILFYDPDSRQFVQNTRHHRLGSTAVDRRCIPKNAFFAPYAPGRWDLRNNRRIWQSRSHDFFHWTEPLLVAAPDDEQDELDESYYGMCQFKIGSTHFACVGVLHGVENTRDVQLLISHDGMRWKTTNKRRPFLAPRGKGHWDAYMQSIVSPPIEKGDELWFYHGGSACSHDYWLCPAEGFSHLEHSNPDLVRFALGVARLRKDGFCSIYANQYREGILMTPALVSRGTGLVINARCRPGGSIRVEVTDQFGRAIEPCLKDQCDPFVGDDINHRITWAGRPDIPADDTERLAWRKLRFFLRDAEIFSFRFSNSSL